MIRGEGRFSQNPSLLVSGVRIGPGAHTRALGFQPSAIPFAFLQQPISMKTAFLIVAFYISSK